MGCVHTGGRPYQDYAEFCADADLLVHDAEYTPAEYKRYFDWGHSVYTDALKLAFEAEVKQLGLFHLNQDRTDKDMDKIETACRKNIRDKGSKLKCFGVKCGMVFKL